MYSPPIGEERMSCVRVSPKCEGSYVISTNASTPAADVAILNRDIKR